MGQFHNTTQISIVRLIYVVNISRLSGMIQNGYSDGTPFDNYVKIKIHVTALSTLA